MTAAIIAALFGLTFGSFVTVLVHRTPRRESVARGRSKCPSCGATLTWRDNIPVVSWLLLRGKCRSCGLPISPMYPLVELATAVIWAFMVWRYGATLHALSGAVFFTILLGIALTDLRAYLIPDEFSVGGLVLGLVLAVAGGLPALGQALLGSAVGFAVLWLIGWLGAIAFR